MTNKTFSPLAREELIAVVRAHTRHALAGVGLRLARSLAARFGLEGRNSLHINAHGNGHGNGNMSFPANAGLPEPSREALLPALAFAEQFAAVQDPTTKDPAKRASTPPPAHPLLRIANMPRSPVAARLLEDLLLLACLPDAHEGFATLCRLLHPAGLPLPTATLALHWLESEATEHVPPFAVRDAVEDLLCHSPIAAMGLVHLQGDGPWHSRNLVAGPGVWEALMACPPQLAHAELVSGYTEVPGLNDWLGSGPVQQAVAALHRGIPCQILLAGGDPGMRATRVRALLGAANAVAIRSRLDGLGNDSHLEHCNAAYTAAFMHQACLWLESREDSRSDSMESANSISIPEQEWALPILTSAQSERQSPTFGLPLIRLPVQALAPVARRALWQALLPQLGEQANLLAARYPIDPDDARDVVRDLGLRHSLESVDGAPLMATLGIEQVGECIRARTSWSSRPGIQRVQPQSDWPALLLPDGAHKQLHSAVRRVLQQITVLDDWGFAQGRAERRGVRMLFFGSPGTGKTLAAEVMAKALGIDMLVVDLASLVSKWIGETEKNLAAVFDIAERSRALLLFDEADALFAKRTETQDAHDRYANLETAYLLQRLERYEGVAVLTTNLRSNLDKAFARRFEYIVEFPEPDAAAREALWRLHLPSTAPLALDVNLAELAAWYPISGAQIKNAALTAAFFAAAAGGDIQQHRIQQHHFLLAIEREFDKAGRAHPGFPSHTCWPSDDSTHSSQPPSTSPTTPPFTPSHAS